MADGVIEASRRQGWWFIADIAARTRAVKAVVAAVPVVPI